MEPRKDERKKDEQIHKEEKHRSHFRPAVERLEERITPSGAPFLFNPAGHSIGGHGGLA